MLKLSSTKDGIKSSISAIMIRSFRHVQGTCVECCQTIEFSNWTTNASSTVKVTHQCSCDAPVLKTLQHAKSLTTAVVRTRR